MINTANIAFAVNTCYIYRRIGGEYGVYIPKAGLAELHVGLWYSIRPTG